MSVKVSISSYSAGRSPENAVRNLVQAGFEYAELGTSHGSVLMDRTPEEWVKFREFAEGMGLKFRQGHLLLHRYITEKDEALRKYPFQHGFHRQYRHRGDRRRYAGGRECGYRDPSFCGKAESLSG